MEKYYIGIVFAWLGITTCLGQQTGIEEGLLLLEKSKKIHDRDGTWPSQKLEFRVQEPRVQNPERFSEVLINRSNQSFALKRRIDSKEIEIHVSNDQVWFKIDGNEIKDETLLGKYRLSEPRAKGYQRFYQTIYGIPMSIDTTFYKKIEHVKKVKFQGADAFLIMFSLREEMIGKQWGLILSNTDFRVLGLEIYHPGSENDERETIWFDGYFEKNGILIARFKHWFLNGDKEYLGSDIIIN
ncbi:hypothetical protein FGF1_39910 [Flavobacteriaceae bacterium GF1]